MTSTAQRTPYQAAAFVDLADRENVQISNHVNRLHRSGFRALPLPNMFAAVDGLYLYRISADGYIDSVVIRSAECAVAVRTTNDFNPAQPLPNQPAVWSESGDLADVVDSLVARLDTGHQPNRITGCLDADLDA